MRCGFDAFFWLPWWDHIQVEKLRRTSSIHILFSGYHSDMFSTFYCNGNHNNKSCYIIFARLYTPIAIINYFIRLYRHISGSQWRRNTISEFYICSYITYIFLLLHMQKHASLWHILFTHGTCTFPIPLDYLGTEFALLVRFHDQQRWGWTFVGTCRIPFPLHGQPCCQSVSIWEVPPSTSL